MIINRTTLSDDDFLAELLGCHAVDVEREAHPLVLDFWRNLAEEFESQIRSKDAKRTTRTAIEDVLQWQNVASEIRAYLQVQEAIASVEPMGALERIDPQQWAQMDEYFKSKWRSREPMAESDPPPFCPPPGPCACEHSFAAHQILGEVGGCRSCGCFDYVEA